MMSRLDIDLVLFGIALAAVLVIFLLTRSPGRLATARNRLAANLAVTSVAVLAGGWLVFEASHSLEL